MGAATSVRRVVIAVLGCIAVAGLILFSSSPANAQIDFSGVICGILQSLGNVFGGFLSGILGFLLELFGCAPASP